MSTQVIEDAKDIKIKDTVQSSGSPVMGSKGEHNAQSKSPKSKNVSSKFTCSSSTPSNDCQSILFLKENHAKFNAPSKRELIFFDECNRQIISLRNDFSVSDSVSKTRIVFQQTDVISRIELTLPIERRILSIKFNPSGTILAYHVERNIVEFVNVKTTVPRENESISSSASTSNNCVLDEKRYVQSSRAKNSKLIGFLWTDSQNVVLITDLSVEYYHVDSARRKLSHTKVFQSATNWFVYLPSKNCLHSCLKGDETEAPSLTDKHKEFSLLIVSTGSLGNAMQPYMFTDGQLSKLNKFEVEGNWHDSEKLALFERSITVGFIYGHPRLLVLQHESMNIKSEGAQIAMYTIDIKSGNTSRTHTLDLDTNGRFAINIVDNLVVAHNQPSKASFIFDIGIESTEKSDCPAHFVGLINSQPIRSLTLTSEGQGTRYADMYSLNWVFFQPHFIVDAKQGLLCELQLDLDAMQNILQSNQLLLSFLIRRRNSEATILKRCSQIVCDSFKQAVTSPVDRTSNPLADVSSAFEILSHVIVSAPNLAGAQEHNTSDQSEPSEPKQTAYLNKKLQLNCKIHQEDIEREVLRSLFEIAGDLSHQAHFQFVSSVLLELIFAIQSQDGKNVDFCIYESFVRCLVEGKRFFQIIQLIRSEILKDSKQLACLLISLRNQYKPAGQLGLDMFHRLPCGPPPANLTSELFQE